MKFQQRRERDSNPRWAHHPRLFSRQLQSTALPSLRGQKYKSGEYHQGGDLNNLIFLRITFPPQAFQVPFGGGHGCSVCLRLSRNLLAAQRSLCLARLKAT